MHIKWENPTLNKLLKHADLRDNRLCVTRVNVPPSTSHTAGIETQIALICTYIHLTLKDRGPGSTLYAHFIKLKQLPEGR